MRRIPAIVLLLVAFSLSLISPLLLAAAPKELPACCRRDGKHHCAKQMAHPPVEGLQIAALSSCPLFPAGKITPAAVQTGVEPPVFSSTGIALATHPAPVEQAPFRLSETGDRPWQQRGPPSFVS